MRNVIGLFLAITVAITAPPALGSWSGTVADQPISYQPIPEDSMDVKTASFCAGVNGELYAVYALAKPPAYDRELYFSKSVDGGYTWSGTAGDVIINANDGQNVYQSANKKYTDIYVDSEGRIFIVWCEDYENTGIREIMLIYSTDGGATWENSAADVPISYSSGASYDAGNPSLAIDLNDNLHVVWHQKTDGAYNKYEILYSKSTDHGLTWTGQSADREISFRDSISAWDPDIETDSAGNIFIVWNEMTSSSSDPQLLFGKSTDGGATFSCETADIPITIEYKETGKSAIHIDAFNNIHVVYKGSISVSPLTKLCLYTGSSDGGSTWSGMDSLIFIDFGPTGGINSWNPDITSSSNGTLAAVYTAANPTTGRNDVWVSYSYDMGATWSGNTNPDLVSLPDYTVGSYVPYIVTGPGDTLHVVWREGLTSLSREDMYYSRGDTLAPGIANPGFIDGIVKEQDDITPIENVEVLMYDSGDILVGTDTTDAGGEFDFSLYPDTYHATFSKSGYRDTTLTGLDVVADETTTVSIIMYPSGCDYVPGDANGDGSVLGSDVTYSVRYFKGLGPNPPDSCWNDSTSSWLYSGGDSNGNCAFTGSDVTFLVAYFKGNNPEILYCPQTPPVGILNRQK